MKKRISIAVLLAVCVACSFAGDRFFFGSGDGTAATTVVVPKGAGTISAQDVLLSIETNQTVTVYRAKPITEMSAAASASTTIIIATDSSNVVDGVTVGTSDFLVIGDQFRDISAIAVTDGGLISTCTVTVAATAVAGQPVYVVDAGDNLSLGATTTWANGPIPFLFEGFNGCPAVISIPALAGDCMVSGKAVYK